MAQPMQHATDNQPSLQQTPPATASLAHLSHSCDVEQLKTVLKLSEHDSTLLNVLQQANKAQKNRPHAYFDFPGTKGSMISLPPLQKWPSHLGWSFSTWLRLEPKGSDQPYLYNFKTGKTGLGYSAHFTGNCLVVTSIRFEGKGVQHCVAYEFPSHKWVHCAITYQSKWRTSEIRVYVDGQLKANIDMPWTVQTTETFDKCYIGGSGHINTNDRTSDLNCFRGQMSAIYLFSEGLSATQICALHRLGPSYMGQFKYSNESNVNLPPQICKTLYEEKLSSSLFCLFTPIAVDAGTLCIQLAPFNSSTSVAAQNYFMSLPHAALLGHTKAIITKQICFTLQSIGCSKSLLPLLGVLARRGDSDACASLIGFICDLLESSPHWFANDIVQNNGFVIIAHSLSTNPRLLLSERLLHIFLNLSRTLLTTSSSPMDSLILKHFMDNILFNPSLWIYADAKLQIKLYEYLATEFLHGTRQSLCNKYTVSNAASFVAYNPTSMAANTMYNSINSSSNSSYDEQSKQLDHSPIAADLLFTEVRRISTILQSLHALKYYYWLAEEDGINPKARDYQLRPVEKDLRSIRRCLLEFTKELVMRSNTAPLDEAQGLLNYLSACAQPENLIDILDCIAELISINPTSLVSALDHKQCVKVFFTLIGSKSELVRIKAIRLMSLFLSHCSHKKKQEIIEPYNLFMLLVDRLKTYRPLSFKTYEALLDLALEENLPERGVDSARSRMISAKRIRNSLVIKAIATLITEGELHIRNSDQRKSDDIFPTGAVPTEDDELESTHDIRALFINDLWNLIVNSRDNRRIILQMSVWQHWLINIIDTTIDETQLITDQVLAIFRVLLYHAIRYEYGGWRVWVDTLAIIHSKVSLDQFCSQASSRNVSPQVICDKEASQASKTLSPSKSEHSKHSAEDIEASGEKPTAVSSISEYVITERRGIEMDESDIAEESSAEHKGDPENNAQNSAIIQSEPGLDSVDIAPSRAYRRESISDEQANESIVGDDTTAVVATSSITRQQSLTSIKLDSESTTDVGDSPDLNKINRDQLQAQLSAEKSNKCTDEVRTPSPHVGSSTQTKSKTPQKTLIASPAFRAPEFAWSRILIKLLNDIIFSIECDLYHWRSCANMTDFTVPPFTVKSIKSKPNTTPRVRKTSISGASLESILQRSENQVYITNVAQIVSQMADNVIIAAGGLLPLLAEATGGARTSSASLNSSKPTETILSKDSKQPCDGLSMAQANSLLYRIVSMVDIVVLAATHINLNELEADRNTANGVILRQCLRLACTVTVKNCLVLRNIFSKYDSTDDTYISTIEHFKEMFDSYQGCSILSANGLFDNSALMLENSDLIANIEYTPHQMPNSSNLPPVLPFQTLPIKDTNKLMQPIDIERIKACIYYSGSIESKQSQFMALSSLYSISVLMVSKYRDIIEPKNKPSRHNTSSVASTTSNADSEPTDKQDKQPEEKIVVESECQQQISAHAAAVPPESIVEANLLNFGRMHPNSSHPENSQPSPPQISAVIDSTHSITALLTAKLESTLDTICPLLKSIMCDFSVWLSKALIGSHGQDLVNKETVRTFGRANASPVELVMLLCSQEWQNTLQKNAGLAFIELINEGRVLSIGMKGHVGRVASEAEFILSRLRADDVAKHQHYGLLCSEVLSARLHEEALINTLISSSARRDFILYCKFKEGMQSEDRKNYKLDIWEDDDRRKRRFVYDSWDDATQLFYVPQSHISEEDSCNASCSSDARLCDEKKRINDLQRSIEMGGVDDHCSPSGVVHLQTVGTSNTGSMIDDKDNENSDDDQFEDEDDRTLHQDSMSPHFEGDNYRKIKLSARHADAAGNDVLSSKQHTELPAHSHTSKQAVDSPTSANEQVNETNKIDVSMWEYDDFGSVNEFTGSVVYATECSFIWSTYSIPGLLQITTNELHFEPSQNINEAIDALKREVKQNDRCNNQTNDSSSVSLSLEQNNNVGLRKFDLKALRYCDFLTCNDKIYLNDIRAIFSRQYLLQPNALELFLSQRTSIMFAFPDYDTVKRTTRYLPPVGVGIKYGIPQSRRASLMSSRQLFVASNMTQRWQKREIGNFQYLMFLNTIAGRTYQDLNQYPVFPWILTNYESEELDLNLPTNFRDLSKPVGALNNKRRREFVERYESWDNPKVPAFHYGTHYSTAAFTLNWLSRLRGTYNSSYIALQDGKYEYDSRLFRSIGDAWVSSLVGNQQNVKELIPEFFYLPEMFHSNLGLPEVELPPWAKSAEQFVRMHRIALESELVSCQLHQWIDLIFGYKQRGPEAINAVNTFYYLTYQGNVNLNMIQDVSLREAIETQIKHFGQTPSQLTTEPHPPRFSALHASPLLFSPSSDEVNNVIKFPFNYPVVHISSCVHNLIVTSNAPPESSVTTGTVQGTHCANGPSSVLTITSNAQFQIHRWVPNEQSGGHSFVLDPQLESIRGSVCPSSSRRRLIDIDDLCSDIKLELCSNKLSNDETATNNNDYLATSVCNEVRWPSAHYIVTLNGHYIIMGSFYDNSFRVFSSESGKLCQVIYGHRGPLTCIARSEGTTNADFLIVTGSTDCSLLVWAWNERFAQVEGNGVSGVHNPLPKISISGHTTPLLSANICAELGLIVSGSKNLILVHTTTTGENLLHIDANLSDLLSKTLDLACALQRLPTDMQRVQVQDKQKTLYEASMLGDDSPNQRQLKQRKAETNDRAETQAQDKDSTITVGSLAALAKNEKFEQLKLICKGDYYITSLQFARELAFIVCVALPAPRARNKYHSAGGSCADATVAGGTCSPALLLTFNLKGLLMDAVPIGQSVNSPKLGDVCVLQITRDGEHLIVNDSPTTIKLYRTFGLQPIYAFNTNDAQTPAQVQSPNASGPPQALPPEADEQNRVRALTLIDHRYILVGLENGKIIVYNADFKNLQ